MRRLAWLTVLVALLPATARAQDFTATVSPETVVHGQDTRVTWRVTVRTGDAAVDLPLRLTPRTMPPADAPGFEALILRGRDVRLEGPGSLGPGPELISDPCWAFGPSLPTYGARVQHGFDRSEVGFRLQMPANSESVIVVPATVSADALWVESLLTLGVVAGDRDWQMPFARSGGRRGAYMTISTDPMGQHSRCGDWQRFPHDQVVAVHGRTHVPAGQTVELVEYGQGGVSPLGLVTVQGDGSFRFDGWRPAPGEHVVAARYASQDAEHTDDFAAPVWFAVESAPPAPPVTREPAAPALRGRPVVAGRFVTLRLNCLEACSGVVRLRHDGRRAARRFAASAGTVPRVRVRLPSATLRSLRRRGRLRARIEVAPAGGRPAVHRVTLRRR